jgi:hypothetical protein
MRKRLKNRPRWTFGLAASMSGTFEGLIRPFTNQRAFRSCIANKPVREVKDPLFSLRAQESAAASE